MQKNCFRVVVVVADVRAATSPEPLSLKSEAKAARRRSSQRRSSNQTNQTSQTRCRKKAMQKKLFFGGGRRRWRCLPGPPLNHSRLNPKLKPQQQAQTRPTRQLRPDATPNRCNSDQLDLWKLGLRPDQPDQPDQMQKKMQRRKNCTAKKNAFRWWWWLALPRRTSPKPLSPGV